VGFLIKGEGGEGILGLTGGEKTKKRRKETEKETKKETRKKMRGMTNLQRGIWLLLAVASTVVILLVA